MAKDESNNKSGLINMHDNNSNLITQETYEMVRSYIVKAQSDIYKAVNLGWDEFNIPMVLSGYLDLPVKAGNDANVAAYGEMSCIAFEKW